MLRQVEPRIDALREQVERERDEVDVAGALAVAEQRPLDPLGAGHQAELGGRDGRAAVVVRVHAEDDLVARRDVPLEPLEPVGVDVRRERLDRRRQVDDHLRVAASGPTRRSPPRRSRARSRARCRGSSRASTRTRSRSRVRPASSLQSAVAAHGEVGDARPCRAGRRPAAASPRSSCRGGRSRAARPRSPRRSARSAPAAPASGRRSSCPCGIRSSSTSRRTKSKSVFDADGKPTSISLMPSATSRSNIRCLRAGVHRLDERLVAVAQVGRAPDRRAVDDAVGPGAVGQVDGRVRAVFPVRHRHRLDSSGQDGLLPWCGSAERVCRAVASPSGEGGGRGAGRCARGPRYRGSRPSSGDRAAAICRRNAYPSGR